MERVYYFCGCCLNKQNLYFIWYCDENDGVYVNSAGSLLIFDDLETLKTFANRQNILIKDDEPVFYNLDKLEKRLKNKKFKVDCKEFLNAWNLFDDVSRSVKGNFDSDPKVTKNIYEKLFWGNNLPAVTPKGKFYEPIWSKKEIEIIWNVLLNGIAVFRNNLKYID
jgi:hypothetical protein